MQLNLNEILLDPEGQPLTITTPDGEVKLTLGIVCRGIILFPLPEGEKAGVMKLAASSDLIFDIRDAMKGDGLIEWTPKFCGELSEKLENLGLSLIAIGQAARLLDGKSQRKPLIFLNDTPPGQDNAPALAAAE